MKIKLLTLASVAALGMGVSLAGGPAHHNNHHDSGLFVGLDLGARYNTTLDKSLAEWDVVDGATGTSFTSKKTPWGLSFGGFLGYQIDSHWAVELGYDRDADQKATYAKSSHNDIYKLSSHEFTVALKRGFHLNSELDGFMKVGVAHTNEKLAESFSTGGGPADLKDDFWSPMGAFGVSYALGDNCGLSFQYAYVMGSASEDLTSVKSSVMGASTQRLTVGFEHMFNM